jgi:hypothetical protein
MRTASKAFLLLTVSVAFLTVGGCKKPTVPHPPQGKPIVGAAKAGMDAGGPAPVAAPSAAFPALHSCSTTTVKWIGSRLDGAPDSGSAIQYADGRTQVSYDMIPGIQKSKPGDPVQLCVRELPQNCPPGDNRGVVYEAHNQRSNMSWKAPDSEHACGGA